MFSTDVVVLVGWGFRDKYWTVSKIEICCPIWYVIAVISSKIQQAGSIDHHNQCVCAETKLRKWLP